MPNSRKFWTSRIFWIFWREFIKFVFLICWTHWIWVCPSFCTSVHTSICFCNIFLRIGSLVFFIFCMKLRDNKYSKLKEPSFLRKLSLAWKRTKITKNVLICLLVHYGNIFPWDWLISFFWCFVWSRGTIST